MIWWLILFIEDRWFYWLPLPARRALAAVTVLNLLLSLIVLGVASAS